MKKNPTHKPFDVLFSGRSCPIQYLNGHAETVFVRELPDRYLGIVMLNCEERTRLIELCTYLERPHKFIKAFPAVPEPKGYYNVPHGWADNLSDDSIEMLGSLAEQLNFSRALKKGEATLSAKKMIQPLMQATLTQIMPMVRSAVIEVLKSVSTSTPNMPSSSASAVKEF